MTPNWRCIWGKITRSTGLRGLSSHDVLFYSWGFTQPDAWGLLRRADAKGDIFPYRSTEGRVQKAIDTLIERGKLCQHEHEGHVYIHWCHWDVWQPETVRWRIRSKLEPPFSFVCPHQSGLVRTSPLETETETETERETETKGITPPKAPPSEGGAAGQRRATRRRPLNPRGAEQMKIIRQDMRERAAAAAEEGGSHAKG